MDALLKDVRACTICQDLPLGPNPLLQASKTSKILIAGQAPGRITHMKGIPFDDPSGNRLRDWMGIERETFYNARQIAIIPMGFCFPGTGKSGDLPPRPECAAAWHSQLLAALPELQLTLIIGRYAIDWHRPELKKQSITEAAKAWRDTLPHSLCLPHPSPRNNRWLKTNPCFDAEVIPAMRERITAILS